MADRRLRRTVYVDGVAHLSGTVPPANVAARITNPAVWDGDDIDDSTVAGDATSSPATVPPAPSGPPPRAGKGSGRPAWAAYAAHITGVPDDGTRGRDEIINDLIGEGIIPEEG